MSMTKAAWASIRLTTNQFLVDNAATFEGFRGKATTLFLEMLEDKDPPFARRPPVSLRLICAGDPAAKLIVHPGWQGYTKNVSLSWLEVELLQEVRGRVETADGPADARKFDRKLSFVLKAGVPPTAGYIYPTALDDAARAVKVMRDFLDDHGAVFARSHDNCCCCARGLTDEVSRSRGIGPECIKRMMLVYAKDWNSIVVEQPAPGSVPDPAEPEVFSLTP